MADNQVIMKGNEAMAEAAIRSGCIACGSCYTVCPDYAITIIKKEG